MSPAECPVCLEDMLPGSWVELECGHRLHGQCAVNCFWKCGLRCPSCRNASSHFQAETASLHDGDVEVYPATEDEEDSYRREQEELVNIKNEIARRIRAGDKRVQRSKQCMEKWMKQYNDGKKDVRQMRKELAKKRKLWRKQFDVDHKDEIQMYNAAHRQSYKKFCNWYDIKRKLHAKIKRDLAARDQDDRHDSEDSPDHQQAINDIWNDMRVQAYAWRDNANAAAAD